MLISAALALLEVFGRARPYGVLASRGKSFHRARLRYSQAPVFGIGWQGNKEKKMSDNAPSAGPKLNSRLLLGIAGGLILLKVVGIKGILIAGAVAGLAYLAQKHLPAR